MAKKIVGSVNLVHPKIKKRQVAVKYSDGTAKFADGTIVRV